MSAALTTQKPTAMLFSRTDIVLLKGWVLMMLSRNIQVSNSSDQCRPTYFIVLVEMSTSTHCRLSPYTSPILQKIFRLRDYL